MPQLSKKPLPPEKNAQFERMFIEIVAGLENKYAVREFFTDLLTHTEMKMLAKRLQVALLLVQGVSYNTIRKETRVSSTTIAAVNNLLNTGTRQLREILEDLLPPEKEKRSENVGKNGYYMAGDLLLPLLEDGFRYLRKRLQK